ncbi:MAG: S8 family peptidase [Lewinella sp.]|nr:S8 family peptidase [Lewinella sp.]
MAGEQYPLVFLEGSGEPIKYTSAPGRGGGNYPARDRATHSAVLRKQFDQIYEAAAEQRQAAALPTKGGMYLEFRSRLGYDLVTKSLENLKRGIRLSNIRIAEEAGQSVTIAIVYIPEGQEGYFLQRLEEYATENTPKGHPRNEELINSIEHVRLAVFDSFWRDQPEFAPTDQAIWCEVWLRIEGSTDETLTSFFTACEILDIEVRKEEILKFPERLVTPILANREQLINLIEITGLLGEIRKVRETAQFWMELSPAEQAEWVENLVARMQVEATTLVAVCILDSGVNNGHLLLQPVLSNNDCQTYDPSWGVNDHKGHGTAMSGVAVFGNLNEVLESNDAIHIKHRIESIKILPPQGQNDPKLYGAITQQAASRAEIQSPDRKRILCMAVTEDHYDRGKPTSWSGAIDAYTSGAEEEGQPRRLFIVSAGNIWDHSEWKNFPDPNLINSVQSPGQSWNALTVGAYTDLTQITDPKLSNYGVLAEAGQLSPFSTTSYTWENKWPIKPEILLEGGNVAIDATGFATECDDLSLLTTHYRPAQRQFDVINATSAASAQAAKMAAEIQFHYPAAWPETIRALLVHSAEWTQPMLDRFLTGTSRSDYLKLLRLCGYGVPNLTRALYCTKRNLTLCVQEELQPFDKHPDRSNYVYRDMHIHQLPWPKEALRELGNTEVKLRVTLSYFIEPSPGEIGWKDRYRYQSHGLRFDLNSPGESQDEFIKRLNVAARNEGETPTTDSRSDRWLLGSNNHKLGSLHSDTWIGPAIEIADCNLIGIYPTMGWWRTRNQLGKWAEKAKYALVVSLTTPEIDVDVYTPVVVTLKVPITT